MMIGAGQQHRATLRRFAFLGQPHVEAAGAAEPLGHAGGKHLVNVLHQHDGRGKIPGQALEQDFQGRRPASG
ncbi:hypothetical protein D9M71_622910 [compost metagenome]